MQVQLASQDMKTQADMQNLPLVPGQLRPTLGDVATLHTANVPGEFDRIGPRRAYTWLLLLGSLPVMLVGLAHDYQTFLLFRLAIGAIGASFVITQYHTSVMFAPNIAWRDVNLKADMEERLDLPVVVENDANAAAWGEFTYGAGHDVDDLLLVTVGTGVGGGVVLDGELYRGAFGVGAEIGHLVHGTSPSAGPSTSSR